MKVINRNLQFLVILGILLLLGITSAIAGTIDFEDGVDGQSLGNQYPGVTFFTANGVPMVYGDWTTGQYPGPYPTGPYWSEGNFFAWASLNGDDDGLIYFQPFASHVTIGYSAQVDLNFTAYNNFGRAIDSANGAANDNTGQLNYVTLNANNIAYVFIYSPGTRQWLIDNVETDAYVNPGDDDDDDDCSLISEDFEGNFPPTGWTVIDNLGNGRAWDRSDLVNTTNQTTGSGNSAAADPSAVGMRGWDTELQTGNIDLTSYTDASLSYRSNFQDYRGAGQAWLYIKVVGTPGWTQLTNWTQDHGPTTEHVDLTPYIGQTVRFSWRYNDSGSSSGAWFWHIDDVCIGGTSIADDDDDVVDDDDDIIDDDDVVDDDDTTDDDDDDLVFVPIDYEEFEMGSPDGETGREPDETLHTVSLTHAFEIMDSEFPQSQFEMLMDYNPSQFPGMNHPVEKVSWYDALAAANRLSESSSMIPCYNMTDILCKDSTNGDMLTYCKDHGGIVDAQVAVNASSVFACTSQPFTRTANYKPEPHVKTSS